jgi:hypothetical protein
MRRRRLLLALTILLTGVEHDQRVVAAAPRAGKVVRVERRPAGFTGQPRFCTIQPSDMYGSCAGVRAPEIGERMTAVDRNRAVGVLRVTNVTTYPDGCGQTYNWMIQTVAESGDFAIARGLVLALSDVSVDMRAGKMIDPDKSPTGHSWGTDQVYAIDTNGDNSADIQFVQYACDDTGTAATTTATSACHDVWVLQNAKHLDRLRQDRFRTCY